jgi:hypothetical protein
MSESHPRPRKFRGTIVTDWGDQDQLRQLVNDYRAVLLTIGGTILDRYERDPAYRFVDTKFSLLTGQDFPDSDPVRGRAAIYGWIQARALESMASLGAWIDRQGWLAASERETYRRRIEKLLREVLDHLEELRATNGGRLFFLMERGGRPMRVMPDGGVAAQETPAGLPTSMTDLYYCIGKAAASAWLRDQDRLEQACREFLDICQDLRTGRFYLGQVPLDPRNSMVQPVKGKLFHLGRTIAIKGAARFLECTGREQFLDIGLEFIDHVLERYVNRGRSSSVGARYDMWEFTGEDGRPYIENGTLLCDPGTVMEFVGFCLKLARQARGTGLTGKGNSERLDRVEAVAPEILKRCFDVGFSPNGLGLVRTLDLCSGRFLNDHLSWWGQMEGLRSAVLAAELGLPSQRREIEQLAAKISNAYIGHFVRRDLGLMAYQTIDQAGKPVDAIPATPDADVLYHTGLCMFDCLDVLGKRLI